MAGKLGHEQTPTGQEQRRERDPVRGRAAEAVDEQDRLALAGGEIAKAPAGHLQKPLLEARELRILCVRHQGRLLFEAMDRSGRQDP